MKIALYHNLTSGGSKREAYEFARQFVAAGHTVHLYHPATADEQFLSLSGVVHQTFSFDLELVSPIKARLPGLRKYLDLASLVINLWRLGAVARHIAEVIDRNGYDFVFVHHDRIVQSPYLLRYLQTPSVYYCAEPMRAFYEPSIPRQYQQPQSWLGKLQHWWYLPARVISQNLIKQLDRKNVRYAALLLTNSYFSAENIYRAYGLRARVVYLGVDTSNFRPLGLPRKNFVLSVGAVGPLKGYDFLVKALAHIPTDQRPDLTIVGNTAAHGETRYLERLASQNQVKLEILVNVTEEELVRLYNQARVYVYAPVLEPFGLTPVEAMACGTPVVAVREGGVRESVKDNHTGLLTERVSPVFAGQLSRLLSDDKLWHSFSQNGRKHVTARWRFEQACTRFETVINQYFLSDNQIYNEEYLQEDSAELLESA
jgi:glycosyltransferase involved in cell wall biosynthesis